MRVILKRGRYVLGEDEGSFGIWDARSSDDPIDTFPLTAEGFDEAEARLGELRRIRRGRLASVPTVIWATLLSGVVLWVLSGVAWVVLSWLFVLELESGLLAQAFYWVGEVGYRLALGSVIILFGALLMGAGGRNGDRSVVEPRTPPRWARWEPHLRICLFVNLAVWILAGLVTRALTPYRGFSFEIPQEPSGLFVIALIVETLAFRLWVAALIILGLGWLPRPRGAAAGQPDNS